jgi:D-glycero-beta-D-manno-heptose 1-phosphate adenylyltransferase
MTKQDHILSKIYKDKTSVELSRKLSFWNFKSQKIVFTNGCFDILHRGHIEYLMKAAELGDILIAGLNTDSSVKLLKGVNRPVNNEDDRALFLASFNFISAVVLFSEETPFELIKIIQPDVLVKGDDYKDKKIVGKDIVEKKNGIITTIPFIDGYSTTGLIERIKNEL